MGKNRLYIDASEKSLTIVLESSGRSEYVFDDKPKETLEQMFPLIFSLCEKLEIKYSDIDEIYATTGPGSTTGIRMALTQARVFFALKPKADLYGASTYDVLFKGSKLSDCIVILSDRHNTLFFALYKDGEQVISGHADSLDQIEGSDTLPIVFASCDSQAQSLSLQDHGVSIELKDALLCKDAYKKYTPDEVADLVPLYTEKI